MGLGICPGRAAFSAANDSPKGPSANFSAIISAAISTQLQKSIVFTTARDPIYESVYVGRPWTELDYLQAMTTSAPIFDQVKSTFPEVVARFHLFVRTNLSSDSVRGRRDNFCLC